MSEGDFHSDARHVCLSLLREWDGGGEKADEIFAESPRVNRLEPRDRGLLQEILFGVIRQRRRIDYLLEPFCKKGLASLPGPVQSILRIGAYQIAFLDRIPLYAAIDSSVQLARSAGFPGLKGVVNAVLRRFSENHVSAPLPDPENDTVRYLGVLYSFPDWLVEFAVGRWGRDGGETFLLASNQVPGVFLRANRLKAALPTLIDRLGKEGVRAIPEDRLPGCAQLERGTRADELETFREGLFQVQDPSAQLVGLLVAPKPGETVLDCCSAPGGKTTHLAEIMGDSGKIIALDRSAQRIRDVVENARRLGLRSIECGAADAEKDLSFFAGELDRILVDAPCSGLGVLARRPDLRWRIGSNDPAALAERQSALLENVAPRLRPGGILVYSTCTLAAEENRDLIKGFLTRHPELSIDSPKPFLPAAFHSMVDNEGFLETLPHRDRMDGSFAVRLRKET